MSKFDNNKTIPRYSFIAIIITLIGVLVLLKAFYIMTAKHDYWMDVAKKQKPDSLVVKPNRGNILSDDGELMASSLPEYKMFMDFKVGGEKKDSLWREKVDSICMGLHEIFPEKSAEEFKADLEKGHAKMSQNWPIWPKRVDYNTFVKVKQLPIFSMPKLRGGFHYEENNARRRPFGTLASRTIGDMYGAKDTARFGLELSFDSILRGQSGITHKRKVMNKYLSFVDVPPTDGDDIQTTINVQMQDIAEKAVEEELKLINGDVGVAIVMEVATGDVKAIVNLEKCGDGQYRERRNHAVSDLLEPGSVFKTASVMVALDDGVVDTAHRVNTGNGQMTMHGAQMNDHNRASGGYGTISLGRALQVSSNIGISKVIDECYKTNPERYVDGLYRIGIAEDLHVPITGSTPPRIRKPHKNSNGKYTNWSLTTLPWMSIGYETQVPPISTLTFYNAIANNGKMMKPRFVTRVLREGQVIAEYPPEVLRHQICKPTTLAQIQDLLCKVVTRGTGKKAKSESFLVAGKTGTAQISKGRGGYKSGVMHYLVSFVGYFPADEPRYSCIVCLQKAGLPASGGTMSGWVFHNISEGVMAHNLNMDISNARDSMQERRPKAMSGDLKAASMVLGHLGFDTKRQWGDSNGDQSFWGSVALGGTQYILTQKDKVSDNVVPNVRGMGARDAIYLMERRGIKTKVVGRGKVKGQSLAPGEKVARGSVCTLTMQYQ
ncbi:MAG: transpeptidase family protein [Prevotella sp.]|nr:transpeptidase family protein [Prevotella sp.]